MAWDPGQYLKYGDERLRPGFDLMARIGALPAGGIYDLGCGTGVHARAMAERWPDRAVAGVDSSREMLAKATQGGGRVAWQHADIAHWEPSSHAALIYSNATLQWLDRHELLFPELVRRLAPGGILAVQMPRNHGAPSHTLMAEVARMEPWSARLASVLRPDPVHPPAFYYDLLAPAAAEPPDLWETEYVHVMDGTGEESPVLAWIRGTALRPLLDALRPEERPRFSALLDERLRQAYPVRPDGKVLFPFRRLFMVVRRA